MKSWFISFVTVVVLLIAQCAAAQAPVPGNLWETTTQMDMPGMGMSMPARTQQACLAKNSDQPPVSSPPDSDCTMSDVHSANGKTTWKMKCTGKQAMTGEGEIAYQGQDSYNGKMTMTMDAGTMTMKMSGKRLGDCDAGALKKQVVAAQAQSDKMTAQACASLVTSMQVQYFDGTNPSDCGAKYKADFCKRLSTEQGYDTVAVRDKSPLAATTDLESAGKVCSVDPVAVRDKLCKNAVSGNSLLFVARHCEAEAAPLAKEHCTGRGFTNRPVDQYTEFCSTYASHRLQKGESGTPSGAETSQGTAPPTKDNAIDQGKKVLKKLFPF
jgi:hypothetical protein